MKTCRKCFITWDEVVKIEKLLKYQSPGVNQLSNNCIFNDLFVARKEGRQKSPRQLAEEGYRE